MALASRVDVLTNENILTPLRRKVKPQEIVAAIKGNYTRFDFSAESLSKLKAAGVSSEVLDAMWKATVNATGGSVSTSAAKKDTLPQRFGGQRAIEPAERRY